MKKSPACGTLDLENGDGVPIETTTIRKGALPEGQSGFSKEDAR